MGGFKPGASTALVNVATPLTGGGAGRGPAVSTGSSPLIAREWQTWQTLQAPPG